MVKIIYVDPKAVIVLSFYIKYQVGLVIHDAVFWEYYGNITILATVVSAVSMPGASLGHKT